MEGSPERGREVESLLERRDKAERLSLLADLFMGHRDRLRNMVRFRLDEHLRARLDTSDVLQESYIEVQKRLDQYLAGPPIPFYLWLRRVTAQKLLEIQRFHLGTKKRAALREVPIEDSPLPHTTSEALAVALIERGPSPSEQAARSELKARLMAVLDRMEPIDREIIALRHFEQLSVPESAQALGIGEEAAQKRYLRGIRKLKDILASMPGIGREQEA